jgi:hypothetical protein
MEKARLSHDELRLTPCSYTERAIVVLEASDDLQTEREPCGPESNGYRDRRNA